MKGISPIVTIVLFVALALVAAMGVWYFTSSYTPKATALQVIGSNIAVEYCDGTMMLIRNSGDLDARSSNVPLYSTSDDREVGKFDLNVSGGTIGQVILKISDSTISDGVYYFLAPEIPLFTFYCKIINRAALFFDGEDDLVNIGETFTVADLQNPSFELGDTGPFNWTCTGSNWTWSTEAHSGSRSIKLTGNSSNDNYCYSDPFSTDPNSYYKITYWVKKSPTSTGGSAITDFRNGSGSWLGGWARGSEATIAYPYRISTVWTKKEYLVKTPPSSASTATIQFYRYKVDGSLYFDDFKLEKVSPEFKTINGAELDWEEKIENGVYKHYSEFSWHQQAIKNLINLTGWVHATRIWFQSNHVAEFIHDPGNYEQTDGEVYINIGYLAAGMGYVEVKNSTSNYQQIGNFTSTGNYYFNVSSSFYPTTGPMYIRIRGNGSANLQINTYQYNSTLSGSPSNTYGYTKISDFNFPGNFSLAAWVKPEGCTNQMNQTIISKGLRSYWQEYMLYCRNNRVIFSFMNQDLGRSEISVSISLNSWNHITAMYNSTALSLYKNGSLSNSTSVSNGLATTATELEIGATEGIQSFNGSIDEVLVYNRTLSEEEIGNIMIGLPPTGGMVGFWKFDWNALDSSGNSKDGEISGALFTRDVLLD